MRATTVVNTDVTECVGKAIGHAVGRGKLSNALSVSMDESEEEGRSYILRLQCPRQFPCSHILVKNVSCHDYRIPANEKSGLIASSGNSFMSRC